MENSSDEDLNSDNEYIDLKPLLTDSPFLSDSSRDEGNKENFMPSDDGCTLKVIELIPMSSTPNELSRETDESATDRVNVQSVTATLDKTPPNDAQINTSTPTPEGHRLTRIGPHEYKLTPTPELRRLTRIGPHEYKLTPTPDRRRLTRIGPHEYKLIFDDDLELDEATRINRLKNDTSLISPIPPVMSSSPLGAINFSNLENVLNFSSPGAFSVAQSTPMKRGRAIRGKSFKENIHLGQSRRALNFSEGQERQSVEGDDWVLCSSRQLGNTSMNTSIDEPISKWVPQWKLKQMAEASNTSEDKTDPEVDPTNDSRFVLPAVLKQKEKEAEVSEATRAERAEYVSQLLCSTLPIRRPRRAPKKSPTSPSKSSSDSKDDKK